MKKLCKDVVVDKLHYYSIDELKELRNFVTDSVYDEKQLKLSLISQKIKNLKR
jgi:hypothetical protein